MDDDGIVPADEERRVDGLFCRYQQRLYAWRRRGGARPDRTYDVLASELLERFANDECPPKLWARLLEHIDDLSPVVRRVLAHRLRRRAHGHRERIFELDSRARDLEYLAERFDPPIRTGE